MAMDEMTSAERLFAALQCREVDRVPCAPWFWWTSYLGRKLRSDRERCEFYREYDLDGFTSAGFQYHSDPSVTVEAGFPEPDVVHKVFHTPAGDLSATVRVSEKAITDGGMKRDDILLVSDHNPTHYIKPWIETAQDIECFKYVYHMPHNEAMANWREQMALKRSIASDYGVPIVGNVGKGLTALLNLMGGEAAVLMSMDSPDAIDRYMEIEHETNMKLMQVMLDEGAKIIVRNGFYETTDFWNPEQVSKWIIPRVNEEAELVHQAGGVLVYTSCTGIIPLLDTYLASKIDGIVKYETKLTGQTLPPIAEKLAGKMGLWGGISDCEDLGRGTPESVRQAVRGVFELVGRRGLVLAAGPSIKPERPHGNVLAMFDEWKKLR